MPVAGKLWVIGCLQAGQTLTANEGGTIGGRVYVDNNGTTVIRAALFYDKKVELVPPLSDHELDSYVSKLTDSGIALVVSTNSYDWPPTVKNWSYALYQNGRLTKLDFSEKNGDKNLVLPWFLDINNQGLISGKKKTEGQEIERAFVFNPRTVEMTTLDPLWEVGDIYSWALSINNGGKVLGYSFNAFGIPARIGVWSSQEKFKTFKTYFDENQAGFVSNYLLFNDNNLIIITDTSDGKSYLVPTPYVLLDLTNLVNNGSLGSYTSVVSVNNQGDMAGYAWDTGDTFLLKRIGPGKPPK